MNIIFISSMCSNEYYKALQLQRTKKLLDSSQKFFNTFVGGFGGNKELKVKCICIPPISRSTLNRFFVKENHVTDDNIEYWHIKCINLPIIKTLGAYKSIMSVLKRVVESPEDIIIIDPLIYEAGLAAVRFRRQKRNRIIGFLTDLPNYASANDERPFYKKVIYAVYNKKLDGLLKKYDAYIFLTKQMNEIVNKKKKPWLLIECIVDAKQTIERGLNSFNKSVIYAGKLHKEFGLDLLIRAIPYVKSNCEFHFYGDGNVTKSILELSQNDDRVFFHGIVPLNEIIEIEKNASILINPRRASDEFTKYSFPSKTAEYMSSGRPVVMFKLPGIPDEYDEFLLYIESETAESIADTIDKVLARTEADLREIGFKAQKFIVNNKNSVAQANRVIKFVETELASE